MDFIDLLVTKATKLIHKHDGDALLNGIVLADEKLAQLSKQQLFCKFFQMFSLILVVINIFLYCSGAMVIARDY